MNKYSTTTPYTDTQSSPSVNNRVVMPIHQIQAAEIHTSPVLNNSQVINSSMTPSGRAPIEDDIRINKVKNIIRTRKWMGLVGIIAVIVTLVSWALLDEEVDAIAILALGLIALTLPIIVFVVNSINAVNVRPSYRYWNKVVYIYMVKIFIVFEILRIISNISKFLDPLHGFKDPTAMSKTELVVHSAVSAANISLALDSLTPAKYIEDYFNSKAVSESLSSI